MQTSALFNKPMPNQDIGVLKEKILSFISGRGPVLPVHISKAFGSNIVFAGAILSELLGGKQVMITKGKIGSSPLYYVKGQEPKLIMLRDYMGQRQRQSFDLLQQKKVVREADIEPVERVAMKDIPDFAVPLYVTIGETTEVFWKWYLVSEEDAKKYIAQIINPAEAEPLPSTEPIAQQPAVQVTVLPNVEDKARHEIEQRELHRIETFTSETIKPHETCEVEKPKREKLKDGIEPKKAEEKTQNIEEEKKAEEQKIPASAFRTKMLGFLSENGVSILKEIPSPKKTELYFKVKLPSHFAEMNCLIIAKSKKKLSEDDVNLAFALGIQHKLPVILVAKELAKKAEKAAEEKGVAFKKL